MIYIIHLPQLLGTIEDKNENENETKAKALEVSGVKAAESCNIEEALKYFSQAIEICPTRASCYNNRAQAFRLKGDVESMNLHALN